MFAWFQRLLPQRGDFFGLFEAHAAALTGAAKALDQLAANDASLHEQLNTIQEYEHIADDVFRDMLKEVRSTFLTPFDRSAITSLIGAMDDAVDEMLASARAIDLYELRDLRPEMKEIIALIVEAANVTVEAVPLLRDVNNHASKLHQLTERLVQMEGQADDIHAAGLKRAFQEVAKTSSLEFAVAREVLNHLERVTDAFEDVANEIDGIVIDHA